MSPENLLNMFTDEVARLAELFPLAVQNPVDEHQLIIEGRRLNMAVRCLAQYMLERNDFPERAKVSINSLEAGYDNLKRGIDLLEGQLLTKEGLVTDTLSHVEFLSRLNEMPSREHETLLQMDISSQISLTGSLDIQGRPLLLSVDIITLIKLLNDLVQAWLKGANPETDPSIRVILKTLAGILNIICDILVLGGKTFAEVEKKESNCDVTINLDLIEVRGNYDTGEKVAIKIFKGARLIKKIPFDLPQPRLGGTFTPITQPQTPIEIHKFTEENGCGTEVIVPLSMTLDVQGKTVDGNKTLNLGNNMVCRFFDRGTIRANTGLKDGKSLEVRISLSARGDCKSE